MAGLDTRGLASGFAQGLGSWRSLESFRITAPRIFGYERTEWPQVAREVN